MPKSAIHKEKVSSTKSTKAPRKKRSHSSEVKKKIIRREGPPSNKEIILALQQTFGRAPVVARMLGIERTTLWKRIKRHPELAQAVQDSRQLVVPFAETKLMQNVAARDQRAIEFVLKNKGKGWNAGAKEEEANDLGVVINIFESALAETKPASLPDNIIDVTANRTT